MSTETAKITDIRAQLARDEGCVLVPYRDSKGLWTVGIGHCLGVTDPESIPEEFRGGITQTGAIACIIIDVLQAAIPDTSGATLSQLENEVNKVKAALRNMNIIST